MLDGPHHIMFTGARYKMAALHISKLPGILGRNFLQFCTLEIDGLAGRVVIRIGRGELAG